MVQIVLFDTETNGLPKDRGVSGNKAKGNWPDILSICWMVYQDSKLVKTSYSLIKPEGWKVTQTEIHGLTEEMCNTQGKPLRDVIMEFLADVSASKYVVAHNLNFDKNVVFSAAKWRLGLENPQELWTWDKDFCTACKSSKGGKFPKLDALYESLFGKDAPQGAHNALRDVEVLRDVFFAKFWPSLANAGQAVAGQAVNATKKNGGYRRRRAYGRSKKTYRMSNWLKPVLSKFAY